MAKHIKLHQKLRNLGCSSVGDFEKLAGIPSDNQSRFNFWIKFKHADGNKVIEDGINALLSKISRRIKSGELVLL